MLKVSAFFFTVSLVLAAQSSQAGAAMSPEIRQKKEASYYQQAEKRKLFKITRELQLMAQEMSDKQANDKSQKLVNRRSDFLRKNQIAELIKVSKPARFLYPQIWRQLAELQGKMQKLANNNGSGRGPASDLSGMLSELEKLQKKIAFLSLWKQ